MSSASYIQSTSISSDTAIPIRKWLGLALTVIVLSIAYGPLMTQFFVEQWEEPQYQHFPFVIGASLILLTIRYRQGESRPATRTRLSNVFLLIALASLATAYLALSPWLAAVSFNFLLGALFARLSRQRSVQYLWGIWGLLWLIIPLPLNRDVRLITFLQRLSSRFSSMLLDQIGVPHLMEGNTLLLSGQRLFVDEACSGIVSVISIIACAAIYGVARNRSPLHVILLVLSGAMWATVINVVRITAIAVVYYHFNWNWMEGTPHEVLGLILFCVMFVALISTDRLILVMLEPVTDNWQDYSGEPILFGSTLARAWDWLCDCGQPVYSAGKKKLLHPTRLAVEWTSAFALGVIPLMTFGGLAAVQFGFDVPNVASDENRSETFERAIKLGQQELPPEIGGLKLTDFEAVNRGSENMFGEYSRTFTYQDQGKNQYFTSCDFPFMGGWHDLSTCYAGVGWEVIATNRISKSTTESEQPWAYVLLKLAKSDWEKAAVLYCEFDEFGELVQPPQAGLRGGIESAFARRHARTTSLRTYQVQIWIPKIGENEAQQLQLAEQLLLAARTRFRQIVKGN